MHEKNPYIQRFKYLWEHDRRARDPGAKIVINANRFTNQFHRGTLNAANPEDFAAIVTDERGSGHYRDIQIQVRGGGLQKVNEFHRSYDALQYPILLWNGQVRSIPNKNQKLHSLFMIFFQDGYDMRKKETKETTTTSCQFYAYQVMERDGDFNTLLKSRTLMAQFVVDMYAKVTFVNNFLSNTLKCSILLLLPSGGSRKARIPQSPPEKAQSRILFWSP